jgi:glutamate---cysteine ligase / carboxylate-amine ligase
VLASPGAASTAATASVINGDLVISSDAAIVQPARPWEAGSVKSRSETLPEWSAWRAGPRSSQFTIGIEEELMLLDGRNWSLAFRSDQVIADLGPELRDRVTLETHAAVMEITTGVHGRVQDAVAELADLRAKLSRALTGEGLRPAVAGTHPCAVWSDTVVSSHPRYRRIGKSMRVLARREPTLALHVHVGVATPEDAIRIQNRLRAHLPLLLALSANSPFWQGRATGFASTRTTLFGAFPRSGAPRAFRGYRDWAGAVEPLIRSGAIADPTFLWWDVRLQPRYGTVEVRIMDGQTRVEDVAALAALVQSLARLEFERPCGPEEELMAAEVIEENRFLAARDGMEALLINVDSGERIPATEQLELVLGACQPHAELLGCARELAALRPLAAENGASRQLACARDSDLRQVTADLAGAYHPALPLRINPSYPARRAA